MPKLLVLSALLLGCSTSSATGVHIIAYPWQCGVPRVGCYTLGFETADEEATSKAAEVCVDGVKTIVPNPDTHKALIVCN